MGVDDEAGDVVRLVGDDGFGEEVASGTVGQGHLGGDALAGRGGGEAGQRVAGAERTGAGEQGAQIREAISRAVDRMVIRT